MTQIKVDPQLAEDIQEDMAEQDGKSRQTVKSEPCTCTGLSPDGTPGTGLLDAHTICPRCQGTGKIAVTE